MEQFLRLKERVDLRNAGKPQLRAERQAARRQARIDARLAAVTGGPLPPSLAPGAVNLLTAGQFAVLTKTGVTTVGTTSVAGNMGTSPIAATALTGFALVADSSNNFSKSSLVTGNVYAADYAAPTPAMLTQAVLDMQAAYVDAATRPNPDYTEFGAGNVDNAVLEPGLYKWGTVVTFANKLTFKGSATDVWILQIAGGFTVGSGATVELTGGAKAENIFYQVAGVASFGTNSHVEGIILCMTAITFTAGSSLTGAALAQTAVTIDAATITRKSMCEESVGCFE